MGLFYEKKDFCCTKKKEDTSCFCGKYIESFIGERVTVSVIGGPGGGFRRTGMLMDFLPKPGIIILNAETENGPDPDPAATLHICCKYVSSISRTPL
ncbi:hypothetical protein [Bacillus sp. m3-13]|uniref:hypothetical protein n=1 Tax=Bacillus sp. m3-13 TaxID=406124 RepID=UPI0001E8908F|nr:hypothetical protein [Bacillus sp. m3-13]